MSDAIPENPLYVTTPIYYVNAAPHLGTFYTTVLGDAFARFHRARHGQASTFLLTGLDEHGAKIERIAAERGLEPKAYCDEIAEAFRSTWKRFGMTHDRFIRTTDQDHVTAVKEMWRRMTEKGDIYEADYEGLYCVGCEGWKTEEEIVTEGNEKLCPIHRKPLEPIKERNYFFRLSRYADQLLALYASPDFDLRPASRRNEVIEFVKGGLRDISASRTAVKWGIPVPGAPDHVVYVWIDALTNYLTALGGPTDVDAGGRAGTFWKNSHHLIGKDILRFHAVYWPAILMSAGLPPPRRIICHGFLTVKGQKISKAIPATRVEPNAIGDVLGPSPLRYFVLREYTLGADGDFSYEALLQRYESDLGNDLGNLLNRTVSMARKYLRHDLLALERPSPVIDHQTVDQIVAEVTAHWENFAPSRALEETWRLIRGTNVYLDHSAPWNMAKLDDVAGVMEVISNALEMIRIAALLVAPAMPDAALEILRQIGRTQDEGTWPSGPWVGWPGGTMLEPVPVFPRLDPVDQQAHIARWSGNQNKGSGQTPAPEAMSQVAAPDESEVPPIAMEDFTKIDLRAALVLSCEPVPKTTKLLKLTLDIGGEPRTVVSGIAGAYQPADLIGRTVIYLSNLKPAKIRGVVSQGMILAAGDEQVLGLSAIDRAVAPGTRIR